MPSIPIPITLTLFLEILLPGTLGMLLSYPLLPPEARVTAGISGWSIFFGLSFLMGLALRMIATPLVDFSMGRYWIPYLRNRAVRALQKSVERAEAEASKEGFILPQGIWRQRFLDAFIVGSEGRKKVVCPTILGNGFLAVMLEFAGEIIIENPTSAMQAFKDILSRWLLTPRELRAELAEYLALSSAMLRLSVLAAILSLVYLVAILFNPTHVWRYLAYALGVNLIARVLYGFSVYETLLVLNLVFRMMLALRRQNPPQAT